ncbi:restriction endonuclease [Streptomyces sp. NPDC046931]|uniref:restriction endonuclease n=1 Tax=Streptomyces sp. NPDC046931 TaxID=3154806 RepID=UPI003403B82B
MAGVQRVRGDTLGGQMTGYLPDGRKAAVECERVRDDRSVDPRRIRTSDDAARVQPTAEVTILVAPGPFTKRERKAAARRRLTLIDADRLESWMKGTTLSELLVPKTGKARPEPHERPGRVPRRGVWDQAIRVPVQGP